jgi:hypothetical protein
LSWIFSSVGRALLLPKQSVHKIYSILVTLLFVAVSALESRGESFQLADGTAITGEVVLPGTDAGLNIRLGEGKYQRVAWPQFSQATLQELAKNPKLAPFVQSLIEVPEEERLKKTEVTINPVPRLERPTKSSILGGLFQSSVGLVVLLLIYAGNIYVAYEISIMRAYPAALVCGLAAVAPVIGPIIFLCVPTRMPSNEMNEEEALPAEESAAGHAPHAPTQGQPYPPPESAGAAHTASAKSTPESQVFKRGQFTFNRRFIETKFPGFFGVARREGDKDMVLVIKSARGEYTATRITRITGNEMHVEVRKGQATQEITVAFTEIMELTLKHKDA